MADLYRDATRHGGITNTKVSSPILELVCSIAALKLLDELILFEGRLFLYNMARVSDTSSDAALTVRKET